MMVELEKNAIIGVYAQICKDMTPISFTSAIVEREKNWAELGESGVAYEDDPIFIEPEFAHVKYDSVKEIVPIANASNYEILSYGMKTNDNNYWFVPEFMVKIC